MSRTWFGAVFVLFATLGACNGSPNESATASIAITIAGLQGAPAALTITGKGGFNQSITGSVTLAGLAQGWYLITAAPVAVGNQTFVSTPESLQVELKTAPAAAAFTYALASGSMAIAVSGLPGGVNANVLVTGAEYSKTVTAPQTLDGLLAGDYTVTGNTVVNGTTTFGGTPFTQTISVPASSSPATAAVAYSAMTGQLTVNVSGLPGATNPSLLVTGPFAYSHAISASGTTTLSSLPLGTYSVGGDSVAAGQVFYDPNMTLQMSTLTAGARSESVTVAYAFSDLTIDGMYITQGTQTYSGSVLLVANRDGFLRVFVKASHPNNWTPSVRVRWYLNDALVRTDTIVAPGASVPVSISEGVLKSSWNLPVPGSLMQQGLSVLADVDPSNVVAEGNEANNEFPLSGAPMGLAIEIIPPPTVIVVPISTPDGHAGDVNAGNVESYLSFTQKIHPIPSHVTMLHSAYMSLAPGLQPDDANDSWITILSELVLLRIAEPGPYGRNYYGVVDPPYNGGIIGIGYVGYPVALGTDRSTPHDAKDEVVAHELGHNWGRMHSPCGNPGYVDPQYPYPNGDIGAYGFDVATRTLYAPTTNYDIVSYCAPQWVSDYTYSGVLGFLAGFFYPGFDRSAESSSGSAQEEPALLVWGHMHGSKMVLEPAFEVTTRAKLPSGSGAYVVEALDASGAQLFSYAFDGERVADEPGDARGFAFAIPLARFDISRLATLQLRGRGQTARVSAAWQAATGVLARLRGGRAEVRWNSASYPLAMIRDAHTGEVLSIGRRGSVQLGAPATDLLVTVSNGVRSTTEAVHAQ